MYERSVTRPLAPAAAAVALAFGLSAIGAAPASAAAPTHTIAAVQGLGATTPLIDQIVTVQGVVTADHTGARGSQFFSFTIQDPAGVPGDGASDAITVFLGNGGTLTTTADGQPVAIGDLVTVTGIAGEYQDVTQISNVTAIDLVQAGVGVPAVTELPDGANREAYEGMLVDPGALVLTSTHNLSRFGELWTSTGGPLVKSTEAEDAGAGADTIAAANRAARLLIDDGFSQQLPAGTVPAFFDPATTVVRNGDGVTVPGTGMVLSYGFGAWRLQPQLPLTAISPTAEKPVITPVDPRPELPADVGGAFSIGSFNVLNYFTTFGGQARGAVDAAAFATQKAKIVDAIVKLDADIVALQEIENSVKLGEQKDEALADLVAALNVRAGSDVWDYVRTPDALTAPITDVITNAIIFQRAAATPLGTSFTQVDETVWGNAREPIAQTFRIGDRTVTVVANHFRSKSGDGAEPVDGQGRFNADRIAQAEALVTFTDGIEKDPAKGADIVLLGDFNAYHEEDPSRVIRDAGFTDLVPEKTTEYTYSFDGELGSLDHAYTSASLTAAVTGVDVWTINSPEWSGRQYDGGFTNSSTPFRSSDHDPIKVGFSAAAVAPDTVDIDIVSFNDFHGRLEEAPATDRDPKSAGAAVLAGMIDDYRSKNPNTIAVSAGDSLGGSTFTSFIQQDQPTIDALNAMDLDASALGNHEFDRGQTDLNDRILPAVDFPYLAANVYRNGQPAYQQYEIVQRDGVDVAFIGAITEAMPSLVSPAGITGLEFRPIVAEVNRVAADLTDGVGEQADVIVLLVHEGAPTANMADATSGLFGDITAGVSGEVDAIISAHTHQLYAHVIGGRPVIQSGQYGQHYGHLSLEVDAASGELLSIQAENLPLYKAFPPDAEVAGIVSKAVEVAAELGSVEVARITGSFLRGVQGNGSENRGSESTLGNLIADAHLAAGAERGAQVAFMNPGGLRGDLNYAANPSQRGDADGVVTYAEAAGVQSFANQLFTLSLTGAQIRQVLEQQWQPAGASRPFLKLGVSSNLTYTYDPAGAAGARIGTIRLNGQVLGDATVVKVVANSFLATGGDNFTAFRSGTGVADTGLIDLEASVDYFESRGALSPDYAQRAAGVVLSAADSDGYSPGDRVTADVSSLLFSADGPRSATAVASLGGVVAGSAPVAFTIVDGRDEQGTARIVMTIPDSTPLGVNELVIRVAENGTVVRVPITIAATDRDDLLALVTPPTITGTAELGGTLTVSAGVWDPAAVQVEYQWLRNGQPISGATGARYTVTEADRGSELSVLVSANATGFVEAVVETGGVRIAAAPVVPQGAGTPGTPSAGGGLAFTGETLAPYGAIAVLVLLTGIALAASGRLRMPRRER